MCLELRLRLGLAALFSTWHGMNLLSAIPAQKWLDVVSILHYILDISKGDRAMTTTLKDLDGLSFRNNSANLPHPVDLSRWYDAGYYRIDTKSDCFRLTEAGKIAALSLAGEPMQ